MYGWRDDVKERLLLLRHINVIFRYIKPTQMGQISSKQCSCRNNRLMRKSSWGNASYAAGLKRKKKSSEHKDLVEKRDKRDEYLQMK